jgi:hypothetical protein
MARKGTRVMGLVAAFNSKSTPATPETEMDEMAMETAFEAMLVRNEYNLYLRC